jgi:glycerol-3-phosphate acyltransferase PlsY
VWRITGTLRGGKGAATTYGTLWLVAPFTTVAGFLAIIILILLATRYMSLAVLVAFTAATIWMFVLASQNVVPLVYAFYVLAISLIVFIRFQENIQRLLAGKERRLGERT